MGKLKFEAIVGRLIKKDIIRTLKLISFQMPDVQVKIDEDNGFLDSQLLVEITGPDNKILKLEPVIKRYFERLSNG